MTDNLTDSSPFELDTQLNAAEQTNTQQTQDNTPNAKLTSNYYTELPKDYKLKYDICLPSVPLKTFTEKITEMQKTQEDENLSKEWKDVTRDSVDQYTVGAFYQDRFTDKDSAFEQGIVDNSGTRQTIQSLKFKKSEGELRGELALLKVSKILGIGDVFSIPLPHSGIWVTIKPPAEADLIDFYNSLFREKIVLGRSTSGLTTTNYSTFINNKIYDFILRHVHSVNYSDISKEDLKAKILVHDLPVLEWGFACTMYPNGFDFQRSCVSDVTKCSYVAKATVNPTKLLWIDNSALTEAQKLILGENRPNKLTVESYNKFLAEHTKVAKRDFTIKSGIKFHLKVPTVDDHISDGMRWVNKINSTVESAITDATSEDERLELLNQHVKASALMQYTHFVDYIEIEENVVQDRETIEKVLETLSSDDASRIEITKEIQNYMSRSTIAIIGIPEYDCPSCGFNQNPNPVAERFVNVIPLDVLNLFFTLITLRIAKIQDREV
jgi:hypothetical protein